MNRVPLADALLELFDALVPVDVGRGVRLTEMAVDVPLEVALAPATTGSDPVLLAHPRRWRLFTVFDQQPARLAVRIECWRTGDG